MLSQSIQPYLTSVEGDSLSNAFFDAFKRILSEHPEHLVQKGIRAIYPILATYMPQANNHIIQGAFHGI